MGKRFERGLPRTNSRMAENCFEDRQHMSKLASLYESHLTLREVSLLPGTEWQPALPGWSLIQVGSGTGYWLQSQTRTELETGAVVLTAGNSSGCVRASLLGDLNLQCFNVIPSRLTGLFTLGEQDSLKQAACRRGLASQVLAPSEPVAVKMKEICSRKNRDSLLTRLNLLQLIIETLGEELKQTPATPETEQTDARERLRQLLAETPPDALLEISFDELARLTNCTSRHLSRIFYDLVGMSFRDKRAEIRLARARELLATSQTKVVEVALESGYKSLSFFNLMFTRRYGISPGRWRQKNTLNGGNGGTENFRSQRSRRLVI